MLEALFPRQSNAADWVESLRLVNEDDGQPVWVSVPGDLVASLTVRAADRSGRDSSRALEVIKAATNDGSGKLTAFADGFLEISIDDSAMTNISAGTYEVFLKLQTGGATLQTLIGCINIIAGA